MDQPNKPWHISPWIAWSLVALFAGIALFTTWYYYSEASTAYDNSVNFFGLNVHHSKTTTSTTTTTATSSTSSLSSTANWKTYTYTPTNGSKISNGFNIKYPSTYTVSIANNAAGQTITVANGTKYSFFIEAEEPTSATHDTTTGRIDSYKIGTYTVYNIAKESGSTVLDNRISILPDGSANYVFHSPVPSDTSLLNDWKSDFDTILSTFKFTQ